MRQLIFGQAIDDKPCNQRSQGAQANRNGKTAEATIYCILKERGYSVDRQVKIGERSIYDSEIIVDIMVYPGGNLPDGLIIESKWQETGGSVDEKYPYLVENIKACYPMPCIIILDGNGYKRGAGTWLRSQVDGKKLLHVFSFAEFLSWCNREL